MADIEISNEFELGNAIWAAKANDSIILKNGDYGLLPLKDGVSYDFQGATVANILELEKYFGENWKAGNINFKNTEIINPKIVKSNIKLYYIFQTKLPFNSRFSHPISFAHANGSYINILGNNKIEFSIESNGEKADNQLPKGVVVIVVPVLDDYDIKKSDPRYTHSILQNSFNNVDINEKLIESECEKKKKESIEKTEINRSVGLNLNDLEYKALWTLNSFIKEYARIIDDDKIRGYSTTEFKDGLRFKIVRDLYDKSEFTNVTVINYDNSELEQNIMNTLRVNFLSSKEFSISEYTRYHLQHLNYSFATIGMYQEFESLWEQAVPDKTNKWGFIESISNSADIKKYLAEMINARNWITHHKKIITENKIGNPGNPLKIEWYAEVLNQYQIYALKRPFNWLKALNDFKIEFDKKFPN
jgi:hypothetical protein